jgi:hypothetical protein
MRETMVGLSDTAAGMIPMQGAGAGVQASV